MAGVRPFSSRVQALLLATLVAVAWGAFAFGAVYPWAYRSLAVACAALGLAGLAIGDRSFALYRWTFAGLLGVLLVGLVQIAPLPQSLLASISPATDRFLRGYDLTYAFGGGRHALSIVPGATVVAIGLLTAFGLFLAGLLRVLARESAIRLAKGMIALGVLLAIVGIVQKAMLGDGAFLGMKIYGFWTPRHLLTTPFGPYVNKNHFAGWMLMAVPIGFGLVMGALDHHRDQMGRGLRRKLVWFSGPEGGSTLMFAFAVLLMSLALLMTRSRSGLACFVVIMVLASVTAARRFASSRARMAVAAFLAAFFLITIVWAGADTAVKRFANEPDSVQLRLGIWRVATQIARDFPLLGTGLDTFGVATIQYQPSGQPLHYQEAHNDYIQLLAEGGVITAGLVALTIVAVGLAIRQRFRAGRQRTETYWLRVGASIGLIAIALQSAVEFSLQMPGNAAAFTVLLAIALHDPASSVQRPEARTTA